MTAPTSPTPTLQPPSVLLMGASGTGKTYALSTLLEAGLEVFVLSTEPNGIESLLDACEKKKLDISRLHWHTSAAAMPGWSSLEDMAKTVNAMSYAEIAELKQGVAKRNMTQFMELIRACQDFPDDRTGAHFGDVTTWGPERCLVLDSLSGLNKMAREYVVGYKPTLHQGEWGSAMQIEENLLYKINYDRSCFFVLIAHVDRETDEIAGGTRITVSALGRKLAPQLVKFFSEVVLAKRGGANAGDFLWSTAEAQTDVKNRALSVSPTLQPTFAPIVDAYKRRALASSGAAK